MSNVQALLTLIEHAERERDAAQAVLQRVLAEADAARRQHLQLVEYRRDYQQRHTAQFRQGGAIEVVRHYQSFMLRLDQAVAHQEQVVTHHETRIAPARETLQHLETRVASIRRLIERRHDDARREHDRREQRRTDEAAARAASHGVSPFGPVSAFAGGGRP